MHDVLIVGAGPAGSLAAIILARAGARVRVLERATFPRHKLCGDTFNPGALGQLAAHVPVDWLRARGQRLDGMVLTGPGGVTVRGVYGHGMEGRSVGRAEADAWLVDQARAAGATIDEGVRVDAPIQSTSGAVVGVTAMTPRGGREMCRAPIVIAADGRESRLARAVGLTRYARRPRRWAIGAYFSDVGGLTDAGEMHVRRGHYIGVAPMPDGLANACLVVPYVRGMALRDPGATLVSALHADPWLAPRCEGARLVGPPAVLGPMAVDARGVGVPGLFLAGDAAGFIDPITGDGLRYALQGATLTAAAAAAVLAGRMSGSAALARLARDRRAAFGGKWRFNRALRLMTASPSAVVAAAFAARALPQVFQGIIRYAGDCGAGR
jgi:flavin-dependent dehydrogenase